MQESYNGDDMSRRCFLMTLGAGAAGCVLGPLALAQARGEHPLHEAAFYQRLEKGRVLCQLCPRECIVMEGGRGYCRVRENRQGQYYSLVYGRPCTAHLDPIEKKPFFHVYPGSRSYSIATVGCNLSCKFCQNWDISQAKPEDVSVSYRPPDDIASAAKLAQAKTIAYTYNEPVVFYEYMADCARAGRELGIPSVMVSSGFIASAPLKALVPLLQAIKIDFKAYTQEFYRDVCGAMLQPVLDNLKTLAGSGVWYEIVMLVIPTLNDSADEIQRMSAWIVKELGPDVPLHFSRYHPMYKMKNIPPTPLKTLQRARAIATQEGCHFVYIGNVPGEEAQNTICPSCRAVLIERYGYRVLKNTIVKGRCQACDRLIPGIWS